MKKITENKELEKVQEPENIKIDEEIYKAIEERVSSSFNEKIQELENHLNNKDNLISDLEQKLQESNRNRVITITREPEPVQKVEDIEPLFV